MVYPSTDSIRFPCLRTERRSGYDGSPSREEARANRGLLKLKPLEGDLLDWFLCFFHFLSCFSSGRFHLLPHVLVVFDPWIGFEGRCVFLDVHFRCVKEVMLQKACEGRPCDKLGCF